MNYLRDLLPAVGQGLAGASASRDPGRMGAIGAARNEADVRELVRGAFATPAALQGHPGHLAEAYERFMLAGPISRRMEREVPLSVPVGMAAAPALAAGALSYMSGDDLPTAAGSAIGHATGASLADAIVRGLMGRGLSKGSLTSARMLGGFGGQQLGQHLATQLEDEG